MNNLNYLDLANYNPLMPGLNFPTRDLDAILSALAPEKLNDDCFCLDRLYSPYTQKVFYPHDHQHPMHLKCAENYLNTLNRTRVIASSHYHCPSCRKECSLPGFSNPTPSDRKEALLQYLNRRLIHSPFPFAINHERNEIDQKLVEILESGPLAPPDYMEILTKAIRKGYRGCVKKLLTLTELTQEQRERAFLMAIEFDQIFLARDLAEVVLISNRARSSAVQSLLRRLDPLQFNTNHLALADYLASQGPLPLGVKLKLCFSHCLY